MTAHVPRLPFPLDPLIAEAKRRMRRRRLLGAVLILALAGGVTGATFALRGSGAQPPSRAVSTNAQPPSRTAPANAPSSAYAYLVPANPAAPKSGQWATRVSEQKIQVGDRVPGPLGGVWEVAAVKPTATDGQRAAIRGWPPLTSAMARHPNRKWPNPVWAGRLVLRRAG
jgi:hypothetical protein